MQQKKHCISRYKRRALDFWGQLKALFEAWPLTGSSTDGESVREERRGAFVCMCYFFCRICSVSMFHVRAGAVLCCNVLKELFHNLEQTLTWTQRVRIRIWWSRVKGQGDLTKTVTHCWRLSSYDIIQLKYCVCEYVAEADNYNLILISVASVLGVYEFLFVTFFSICSMFVFMLVLLVYVFESASFLNLQPVCFHQTVAWGLGLIQLGWI